MQVTEFFHNLNNFFFLPLFILWMFIDVGRKKYIFELQQNCFQLVKKQKLTFLKKAL